MRALKLLVIGMGVVIVVATAVLIATIVNRAGKLGATGAPQAANGSGAPIAVPPGFHVAATEISGDRVLVRLEGREPGAASDEIRLLVLDIDPSKPQRTLRLVLPESGR